jgi:act minimal PKS chain-length factor (CLF/KS beta)
MTGAVVATGLGVVAPNGLGAPAFWDNLLAGKTGIDRVSRFDPSGYDMTLVGEVKDFDAADYLPGALIARTDRMTHFALAATAMALEDADADPSSFPEYEMAVITSNSAGGVEYGQRELAKLQSRGPKHVGAFMSIAFFYAANTGQISIKQKMRGPSVVVCAEQAGGLDAIGHARRIIRRGALLAVTGGTDAPNSPAGYVAQATTRRISVGTAPLTAYRPFSSTAGGYVPGEGGAMIIMEDAANARRRGARQVYGAVTGYAATFDPPPGSLRPPGLRRAIELALQDAGLTAGDVDVVLADGHATPELDRREAAAIAAVFGPHAVPVSVPKTLTGRMYSGGSSLDVAIALLMIRDQVIPPTVGSPDLSPECPVDLVSDQPREARIRHVLVVSRGYGGLSSDHSCFNAAVVISAPPPKATMPR